MACRLGLPVCMRQSLVCEPHESGQKHNQLRVPEFAAIDPQAREETEGGDSMNYPALITALLLVTVAAFAWVEIGKPLLTMLGMQDDERR